MHPPRISPRRIFWSALAAACVWSFVGGRTASPASRGGDVSALQRTQDFFGGAVTTMLTPATFMLSGIQHIGAQAVDRITAHHDATESIDTLHQTVAQLYEEIDQRDRQIRLDQELFTATKSMAPQGLRADELLVAGVTAYQSGPGASLITLDKGTGDGVARGMVVTACTTTPIVDPATKRTTTQGVVPQASILGFIQTASAKISTVRLLTDPRMKIQAKIVRRLPEGSAVLTPDLCLVEGLGDGRLRCNTISVNDVLAEPLPGDLVELADQNWPASVRYMVIGEVSAIARKDTQILRYDLTITPRVNANNVQTVLVVLKQ